MITKPLTDFIDWELVNIDYGGGYVSIETPTVQQLQQMQAYIELALLTATEEGKVK